MQSTRIESDSMGKIEVPSNKYWGAQTQRSIQNFPIGVDRFKWQFPIIRSLGILKKAAALANAELGEIPQDIATAIEAAANAVMQGEL
ncbi:MAG TPA: lyase family protein, partial [Burkholderiaceae bacterium]|nr:lyase family protein [Burkholderiaceae bacterium]